MTRSSPWSRYRPSAEAPWSLERVVHLHRRAGFAATWEELQRDLADGADASIDVQDLRQEPRCERSWKRDGTVRERSDGGMLSDRDAEAVGVS